LRPIFSAIIFSIISIVLKKLDHVTCN